MISQQLIALLFATATVSALPSPSSVEVNSTATATGGSDVLNVFKGEAFNGGEIEANLDTEAHNESTGTNVVKAHADNGSIEIDSDVLAKWNSSANSLIDTSSTQNPPDFACHGYDCDDVITIQPSPQPHPSHTSLAPPVEPHNDCGGKPCGPIYPPVKECNEPHCQPKQCFGIDCYQGIQSGGHHLEFGFRQFFQKSFVSVLKNFYSGFYQKCIVDYGALLYQLQYRHFKLSSDCHSCWGSISAPQIVIPKCELTKFNANALSLSFKPEDCQDKVITFGHKSFKLINVIFTEQIFTVAITKATFELTFIGIIEGKQVSMVIPVQVGDKDCGFFAQFGPHLSGDISSGIDLFNVDFSALFVGLQYTVQQVDGFQVAICQTPVLISYQYFAFFAQYLAISVSGSGSGSIPVLGNGENAYQTDIAY